MLAALVQKYIACSGGEIFLDSTEIAWTDCGRGDKLNVKWNDQR